MDDYYVVKRAMREFRAQGRVMCFFFIFCYRVSFTTGQRQNLYLRYCFSLIKLQLKKNIYIAFDRDIVLCVNIINIIIKGENIITLKPGDNSGEAEVQTCVYVCILYPPASPV